MEKLSKLIKNSSKNTKLVVALGVAAAVGTATGVKTVAKKRKGDLAALNINPKQKVSDLLTATATVGNKVVGEVREDITTVVESVKSKTGGCCTTDKCDSCPEKDSAKPCCSKKNDCKKKEEGTSEAAEVLPEVPEPVKADDVVEQHETTDAEVEEAKNEKVSETAPVTETKKPARKPRTPRAPKTEKAEMTPAEPQPAEDGQDN